MIPHRPRDIRLRGQRMASLFAALAVSLAACSGASGDGTGPVASGLTSLTLTSTLPSLDPVREGSYGVWAVDPWGEVHALRRARVGGPVTYPIIVGAIREVRITLEPPGDAHATPSAQVLLRGALQNGAAALTYQGALTLGDLPLRAKPGQFTMFTPSDNAVNGYPSHE